jgi:hypothetical protein
LAAVSPGPVRSALLIVAGALQPLAAGEAVGETASAAAVDAKRRKPAVATIDSALRRDCGLSLEALGQTTQAVTQTAG